MKESDATSKIKIESVEELIQLIKKSEKPFIFHTRV